MGNVPAAQQNFDGLSVFTPSRRNLGGCAASAFVVGETSPLQVAVRNLSSVAPPPEMGIATAERSVSNVHVP
jgi:hypothetical protein